MNGTMVKVNHFCPPLPSSSLEFNRETELVSNTGLLYLGCSPLLSVPKLHGTEGYGDRRMNWKGF
jgi:hypothetical protein